MIGWMEDRPEVWHRFENQRLKVPADVQKDMTWRNVAVLWRDIMATTGVSAPGFVESLGAGYKQKLQVSHHLIYANSDAKTFLAVERYSWG